MTIASAVSRVYADSITSPDVVDDANRSAWVIHKFGGSSVADADCIRRVARILTARTDEKQLVVVSAVKGDTDILASLLESSKFGLTESVAGLAKLQHAHQKLICELLHGQEQVRLLRELGEDAGKIRLILREARSTGASAEQCAIVMGYGEIWASRLFAAYLRSVRRDVQELSTRDVIVLTSPEDPTSVHWRASRQTLENTGALNFSGTLVAPGYIASTADGSATTLGRNGSDCSAAILAALAGAQVTHIWTDVDGILVSDPKHLAGAGTNQYLTFDEAATLARLGAKVLHPATLEIASRHGIKITVRNSFNPTGAYSLVHADTPQLDGVKGISALEQVLVLTLSAEQLIHLEAASQELVRFLREENLSPLMVLSQAPNRTTYVFPGDRRDAALRTGRRLLENQKISDYIEPLTWSERYAILGIVLGHPEQRARESAKFLRILDRIGVRVAGCLQDPDGSATLALVERRELHRAARSIQESFLTARPPVHVAIVGAGNIGLTLLRQMTESLPATATSAVSLSLRAIANSSGLLIGERSLTRADWDARLTDGRKMDLALLPNLVRGDSAQAPIIIDATASTEVAELHSRWLQAGANVVTANKLGVAGALSNYDELQKAGASRGCYAYETTVGAALPVIRTVREMVETGDHITKIRGVLSGTLSYLFNTFDGSKPFSALLREACTLGITEPDPREDLAGMDVARKLLVLAREAGMRLELEDIQVENLVPKTLTQCSVREFLEQCGDLDGVFKLRLNAAKAADGVLRYVAELHQDGRATVGLRTCERMDTFYSLQETENLIEITSARYRQRPLVIKGPGAGKEVTAAGVLSEVLRLAGREAIRL